VRRTIFLREILLAAQRRYVLEKLNLISFTVGELGTSRTLIGNLSGNGSKQFYDS
jgi:hypothetical protein